MHRWRVAHNQPPCDSKIGAAVANLIPLSCGLVAKKAAVLSTIGARVGVPFSPRLTK